MQAGGRGEVGADGSDAVQGEVGERAMTFGD
jgi:hypothetical protein